MVSAHPLITKSSSPFTQPFGIAPIATDITITSIFNGY